MPLNMQFIWIRKIIYIKFIIILNIKKIDYYNFVIFLKDPISHMNLMMIN